MSGTKSFRGRLAGIFIIMAVLLLSACTPQEVDPGSSAERPEAGPEPVQNDQGEPSAADYPIYGGVAWGDSVGAVLDTLGCRDKSHEWELALAMEPEGFLGFPKVGGLLRFDENEKLYGCSYGIGLEGKEPEEVYDSLKETLIKEYGSPEREDTAEVFSDAKENNGNPGARWDNDTVTIQAYLKYHTSHGQDTQALYCDIYVKDDPSLLFMGFAAGTPLDEVLAVWPDMVDTSYTSSCMLKLTVPEEKIFGIDCEPVFIFFPYDSGRLYAINIDLPCGDDIDRAADMYAQIYQEMVDELGPPVNEMAEIGTEEFSQKLTEGLDVSATWDKDITGLENTTGIMLNLEQLTVRKDQAPVRVLKIAYSAKRFAYMYEEFEDRINSGSN